MFLPIPLNHVLAPGGGGGEREGGGGGGEGGGRGEGEGRGEGYLANDFEPCSCHYTICPALANLPSVYSVQCTASTRTITTFLIKWNKTET